MNIFHLEDDKFLPEIFREMMLLANPQAVITHYENSDEALEYIVENLDEIAVFVLDVRVPGSMTGLELAQKIRDLDIEKPLFIASAYQKPASQLLAKLNAEWISKPGELASAPQRILSALS